MNNFLGWYGNVSQTRPVFGFSECLHVTTPTTSQLAWMEMTPCPNPLDPHSTWHACVSARLHAAWTPQSGMIANSFSQFHCHNFWASKQSLIFAWKSDHEKLSLWPYLADVRSFVRNAILTGHKPLGVNNGLEGLINNDIFEIGWGDVTGWVGLGGALLGTESFCW